MERTDKPSLNIYFFDQYEKTQNLNDDVYPKIKKNDYFVLTPIIKLKTNIINNSVLNLKRKRSSSF